MNIYFEASTPGFTHFAVSGKQVSKQVSKQVTPVTTPELVGPEATPTANETIPPQQPDKQISLVWPWLLILIIIVLNILAYIGREPMMEWMEAQKQRRNE